MSAIDRQIAHTRNTTAYFETRSAAEAAVNDLVAAGVPREQISIAGTGAGDASAQPNERSFWEELKDLFLPAEDRYAYAEGLRRGGVVVSVRSEEATYPRVLEILDRDGAVDLEKREAVWREEGWTGYPGSTEVPASPGAAVGSLRAASSPPSSRQQELATASGREEVVPLYQEQLRVGKRDVSHGRVRIRSYVVETPVDEQVRLRHESVQVERRPVDRAVAPGETVFQDRVIEAEEHAEEAVISKEARVKEELTLRRTAEDRTQEIHDTVRHTEVEVQDDRAGLALAGVGRTERATGVGGRIAEHMDVIGSDGVKIGTVDHLDGSDKIKLTKSASPDGQHHYVPLAWVDHVDAHVHLTKTSADAKVGW